MRELAGIDFALALDALCEERFALRAEFSEEPGEKLARFRRKNLGVTRVHRPRDLQAGDDGRAHGRYGGGS